MPDAEFLRAIRDLGGTPAELAAHHELLELMLPTLRADFTAAEIYRCRPGPPLPCPITVFGGTDDPLCSRTDLEEWSAHTKSKIHMHLLPGNHFFVTVARTALLELITATLAPDLAA
jgi:surfactin synthase thioesterase subunit